LLAMPFAKAASASLDPADLSFKGEFFFDKNGSYFVYGVAYPLNVLGVLTVFDDNDLNTLGDLTLQGQKNYDQGKWDETYFGHWSFHSADDPPNIYEIGLFPDLWQFEQQGEAMLEFTLLGFNDVLGIPDDIPKIVGSLDGNNNFTGLPVPIPNTLLLLLVPGLIGILGFKRRVA